EADILWSMADSPNSCETFGPGKTVFGSLNNIVEIIKTIYKNVCVEVSSSNYRSDNSLVFKGKIFKAMACCLQFQIKERLILKTK
ncbi:MAG: hypothetical protein V1689_08145, partial [Pseudomonadota bacterium]